MHRAPACYFFNVTKCYWHWPCWYFRSSVSLSAPLLLFSSQFLLFSVFVRLLFFKCLSRGEWKSFTTARAESEIHFSIAFSKAIICSSRACEESIIRSSHRIAISGENGWRAWLLADSRDFAVQSSLIPEHCEANFVVASPLVSFPSSSHCCFHLHSLLLPAIIT